MADNTPELERANEIRELAREIVDSHPEPLHMGGDNWATEDKQLFVQVAKLWNGTGQVIIRPLNANLGEVGKEVFVATPTGVNTYIPGPWEAYMVQLVSEIKNADEETNTNDIVKDVTNKGNNTTTTTPSVPTAQPVAARVVSAPSTPTPAPTAPINAPVATPAGSPNVVTP